MEFTDFKPTDYIVGQSNNSGKLLKAGQLASPENEAVRKMQEMISNHAAKSGASLLNTTNKQTKKPTKKNKQKELPVLQPTSLFVELDEPKPKPEVVNIAKSVKKYIYLYNKLGKIKMSIEDILECDLAYCLVFSSEEDLIFTPNAGETLTLITPEGNEVSVYYAESLFTWIDGTKQLMVLFKNDDE